jgi:hypothetical protein
MNPDIEFLRGLMERQKLLNVQYSGFSRRNTGKPEAATYHGMAKQAQAVADDIGLYLTRRERELNNGRRP